MPIYLISVSKNKIEAFVWLNVLVLRVMRHQHARRARWVDRHCHFHDSGSPDLDNSWSFSDKIAAHLGIWGESDPFEDNLTHFGPKTDILLGLKYVKVHGVHDQTTDSYRDVTFWTYLTALQERLIDESEMLVTKSAHLITCNPI